MWHEHSVQLELMQTPTHLMQFMTLIMSERKNTRTINSSLWAPEIEILVL